MPKAASSSKGLSSAAKSKLTSTLFELTAGVQSGGINLDNVKKRIKRMSISTLQSLVKHNATIRKSRSKQTILTPNPEVVKAEKEVSNLLNDELKNRKK